MARTANRSRQTLQLFDVLLEQPSAWRHGYELSKQTGLSSGTLYPILMRLAAQGLLEESWEPSDIAGRPLRHLYRLTKSGVAAARDLARDRPASWLRPSKVSR